MSLKDLLLKRRDTRHFTTEPVPDEVLQKALAAAHLAPTVGLSEAARFYVIREPSVKKIIYDLFEAENNRIKKGLPEEVRNRYDAIKLQAIIDAPVGMVVTTDYSVLNKFTIGVSGTTDTLQWSSVCAVQNMWLSLTEQGYSLGWVSILDYHQLKKKLQLPAHEFPLGYFCIGKPATDYDRQPMLQQISWKQKSAHPAVTEILEIDDKEEESSSCCLPHIYNTDDNLELKRQLIQIINNKTKPIDALGILETTALQIGMIQQSTSPQIRKPHIVLFAADHGIARTGLVTPYPQAVTRQMVANFLNGGAAINIFCKQNKIGLKIVDAGINYIWKENEIQSPDFFDHKIALGTHNYLEQPAMTEAAAWQAIESGKQIVKQLSSEGCNCIGFGEMGIGNTSSASLIMSAVTGIPVKQCIGRGTGVTDAQLKIKTTILKKVYALHQLDKPFTNPVMLLAKIGGFEIAMMTGAYLQAAAENMIIVVDGFIATAALLPAWQMNKHILKNCVFAHTSGEQGHEKMLQFLGVSSLLNLGMRLGEGTGAALAIPLLQNATGFLNEMASFDSAAIDKQF